MAEIKTKQTSADVHEFINSFADTEQKRKDSYELLTLMQDFTGYEPKMWGPSIIGFGSYHYKSERSSQEGDWPLIAFSPRKQNLTLYVMPSWGIFDDLFKKLGKHKTSKGCLYINKLDDVDLDVLNEIVKVSYEESKKRLL